jgi:hypothetical protein
MPSAKRRKLLGYKKSGWHGNTAYTLEQIKELIPTTWRVDTLYGFLFLPIHRFPTFLRKYLLALDRLLSQSFLKEYASYYIVILKRV